MAKILVTGTSGFIGSHLAQALVDRGDEVLGLDKRPALQPIEGAKLVVCDLLDLPGLTKTVRSFRPELLFHLAARTDLDEQVDLEVGYAPNITGVSNLVSAIRETKGVQRCICASTQLVCPIGYTPQHDEDYQPTSLYGKSKVLTEQILRRADGGGSSWCLVRPTTVWGPRMNPQYLRFFRMVRNGRYFHIGGGPTVKTYGYVTNTVQQLLKLADAPDERVHRRVFYLADYEPILLEAWAEAFQRELGGPPIRTVPYTIAKTGALVGDILNAVGLQQFPFNSWRLNNVLTPINVNLEPIQEVCGKLPYTMDQGVAETTSWSREVWAESEHVSTPTTN